MRKLLLIPLLLTFASSAFCGELVKDPEASLKELDAYAAQCLKEPAERNCDQEIMDRYHKLIGDLSGDIILLCKGLPDKEKSQKCEGALDNALKSVSQTRVDISTLQKSIYGADAKKRIFNADRCLLRGYAHALAAILQALHQD